MRRLGVNLRLSEYQPMLSCVRSCCGILFVTCRDFPAVSLVTGRDFLAVSVATGRDFSVVAIVTDRDIMAVSKVTGRDQKAFLAWGIVKKLCGRRKNVPGSTARLSFLGNGIF